MLPGAAQQRGHLLALIEADTVLNVAVGEQIAGIRLDPGVQRTVQLRKLLLEIGNNLFACLAGCRQAVQPNGQFFRRIIDKKRFQSLDVAGSYEQAADQACTRVAATPSHLGQQRRQPTALPKHAKYASGARRLRCRQVAQAAAQVLVMIDGACQRAQHGYRHRLQQRLKESVTTVEGLAQHAK
ncbi:hypothetical protein D3C80_787910 [compost metagenome]